MLRDCAGLTFVETDSFFYRLFKELPQTLFELIGQPAAQAKSYRFDSVELKKALRIDGLFLPRKRATVSREGRGEKCSTVRRTTPSRGIPLRPGAG